MLERTKLSHDVDGGIITKCKCHEDWTNC